LILPGGWLAESRCGEGERGRVTSVLFLVVVPAAVAVDERVVGFPDLAFGPTAKVQIVLRISQGRQAKKGKVVAAISAMF
jgi:hypothetical protein